MWSSKGMDPTKELVASQRAFEAALKQREAGLRSQLDRPWQTGFSDLGMDYALGADLAIDIERLDNALKRGDRDALKKALRGMSGTVDMALGML